MKSVGGAAAGGGLLGFAKKVLDNASGGAKFDRGDIKRVYFVSFSSLVCRLLLTERKGNWLRDYSQVTLEISTVGNDRLLMTSYHPGHGYRGPDQAVC